MEGNLRFKIDRASLIVGRNSNVFALFYFVKLRTISKYKTPGGGGAYIWRVFCGTSLGGLYMEGLIFEVLRYFKHSPNLSVNGVITSLSVQPKNSFW